MFFRFSTPDSTSQMTGEQQQLETVSFEQQLHQDQHTEQLPTVSTASPTATSPTANRTLAFAGIVQLFVKLRRLAANSKVNINEPSSTTSTGPPSPAIPSDTPHMPLPVDIGGAPPHSSSSPPSTPKKNRARTASLKLSPSPTSSPTSPTSPSYKSHRTESSSGSIPISHPGLVENACERREPVEITGTYVCTGGVNVPILLRTTRMELMDMASLTGANALVDEQWKCTICKPKSRNKYKVQIHYKAQATRSTASDPRQPVALNQTHNIPGLMTVLRRNDD